MHTLKLWFTDFYQGFDQKDNYFYNLLAKNYNITLSSSNPDYLIYSCYGNDFLNYDCVKIFFTGENLVPDFNLCDFAIGFDYIDFGERYLRYPNFSLIEDQFLQLVKSPKKEILSLSSKEYFCNFIYGNSTADPTRDRFFYLLNDYKKIASPGRHLNNISMDIGERDAKDWMYSKLNFQTRCKFSIAFENASSPGYTTEKIMHAFISNTIPIYWGNPEIEKDFNPKAFINCHNFKTFEEVVNRVKEIDNDPELYNSILNETPFRRNIIPENLNQTTLYQFLQKIFDEDPVQVIKRPAFGRTVIYEENLKNLISVRNKVSKIKRLFSFK